MRTEPQFPAHCKAIPPYLRLPELRDAAGWRDGHRGRARGFTIIEIMVAMFIFGLIFAAIYSSWAAIMRGSKSGLEAAAAVQRSRVAVATIEQALDSTRAFASTMQYYYFAAENGDDASLSFVAKLPESFPRSGRFGSFDVRRVTFSVEASPDSGRQLVLRQNPVLMDMDVDEKEHPIVLAKNVKKFELGFWDVRSGDWVDEWTQTNEIPPMVMYTLRWGGQSRETQQEITRVVSLPSLVVQPGWQGQAPGGQFPGRQFPGGQVPGGQPPGGQFQGGQAPGGQLPLPR